jgi:hypothetical protein
MPSPRPTTTKDIGKPKVVDPRMMTFTRALDAVNEGQTVTRESWDNPELHVRMNKGQLCCKLADGVYHPMIVSQEDFDGEDWQIVDVAGVPKIPGTPIRGSQQMTAPLIPFDVADAEKAGDPRDMPGKDN